MYIINVFTAEVHVCDFENIGKLTASLASLSNRDHFIMQQCKLEDRFLVKQTPHNCLTKHWLLWSAYRETGSSC